jgi:hypothetical protein
MITVAQAPRDIRTARRTVHAPSPPQGYYDTAYR